VSVKALGVWIQQHTQLDLAEAAFPISDGVLLPRAGSCELCPKRAGSNPDLFPDTPGNTCTDGECYDRKVEAFVEQKRSELREQGTEFVEIVAAYRSTKPGVLGWNEYEEAEAGEKLAGAVAGLVVEGKSAGTVVQVKVLKAAECGSGPETPATKANSASDQKEREKQEAARAREAEKRKQDDETRRRVLVAIVGKVKAPLGRAELIKFASMASEGLGEEDLGTLCKITGAPEVAKNIAYDAALAKALAKVSDDVLAKFIVGAQLAEYALGSWSNGKPLFDAAPEYKVDVKKIRDQVADEAKQTKKAEAKPAAGASKPEPKKTVKPAAKQVAKKKAKK
jgi:hypothetical protein